MGPSSASGTPNTTGVGLGLALARGLTEAMGGTLAPEDTPGGGLTMVVSLPAAPSTGGLPPPGPGQRERADAMPEPSRKGPA
jgi:two-component system sensor histidine kinase KdpD